MTEEEKKLAREYAEKFGDDNILHFGELLIDLSPIRKESFIAGLEAGKPQWHKVADGDLPKRDVRFSTAVSIPVLTQDYKFACYYFSSLKWYSQGEEVRVIAWYEIPQYKE